MNRVYVSVVICTYYGLMSVYDMYLYKSDLTLYVFDMTLTCSELPLYMYKFALNMIWPVIHVEVMNYNL